MQYMTDTLLNKISKSSNNTIITDAVGSYVSDVKACDFPNENEQY